MTMVQKRWRAKMLMYAWLALLLLLSACTAQPQEAADGAEATTGIYELVFSVERVSGGALRDWDVSYTYGGEPVDSGYQFEFSLELFAFRTVQAELREKANPDNVYSVSFTVAVCNGGSGSERITVTDGDGNDATFQVSCETRQVGKW